MNAQNQRDQALGILDSKISEVSKLFKECYLSSGKGAVVVYASDVIHRDGPKKHHYRTYEEMIEIFDTPATQVKLNNMINGYNQKVEGIMALITDYSNATYFITVKF